ncbi:ribosome-associated protein [Xanthomonas sp. A2111]|uniref:Dual-action ribosomal maturation protein DarP n=1 Tax=Xanthomonas hawaiiensis TaxID=3003247 RepID=A0ABU2I2N4_9XANT|nr:MULTISPECIES: ribosome biogenesis factor YjgA [unclassified Xanthomonas]MBO9830068.1 ribosome-associated protein [Xanthomonas sp. A2111]MBO9874899.1 ribosome-associated protein [Xanthomonas sp. D-93]MDS9991898.1 ribosome-associated protein [Xanthomonas sp. A2111]WNH43699.1 ribosome-associated protein [Xanthomonas sp. A6251]
MRGRDEDTGEFRGESRSQQRREALEVLSLGEKLVALTPAQLAKLPVPESLLPHIAETKRITSHIAHKRQLAFLAKQMRREDEAVLDAIREAMDVNSDSARREVAAMHRVEDWRERLLAEGDTALAELLAEHPDADRQRLRQLVRNAKDERLKNKPPHAYRELFRELREMILGGASGMENGESGMDDDAAPEDDTRD